MVSGFQSQTTSSPSTLLLILSPWSLAGPQPKHTLSGAYRSCRLFSGMDREDREFLSIEVDRRLLHFPPSDPRYLDPAAYASVVSQ